MHKAVIIFYLYTLKRNYKFNNLVDYLYMHNKIIILIVMLLTSGAGNAQVRGENTTAKYISWTLLQMIPSPSIYQDANGTDARARFGLKWQIIPLNFSFDANKYISPVQFFMINPVRRFSGSAELFLQPELATGEFRYSDRRPFTLSSGVRAMIPLAERGENLAFSLGGKYSLSKNKSDGKIDYPAVEAGLYVFGGMFGIQYTRNFNTDSKYNISLYIKYY